MQRRHQNNVFKLSWRNLVNLKHIFAQRIKCQPKMAKETYAYSKIVVKTREWEKNLNLRWTPE